MSKKIIGGLKDENGIYLPVQKEPEEKVTSIDDLLYVGLRSISKAMMAVQSEINMGGVPSRETVQTLKDLMSMLKDLKKDEKDVLENLTDDQLEQLLESKRK